MAGGAAGRCPSPCQAPAARLARCAVPRPLGSGLRNRATHPTRTPARARRPPPSPKAWDPRPISVPRRKGTRAQAPSRIRASSHGPQAPMTRTGVRTLFFHLIGGIPSREDPLPHRPARRPSRDGRARHVDACVDPGRGRHPDHRGEPRGAGRAGRHRSRALAARAARRGGRGARLGRDPGAPRAGGRARAPGRPRHPRRRRARRPRAPHGRRRRVPAAHAPGGRLPAAARGRPGTRLRPRPRSVPRHGRARRPRRLARRVAAGADRRAGALRARPADDGRHRLVPAGREGDVDRRRDPRAARGDHPGPRAGRGDAAGGRRQWPHLRSRSTATRSRSASTACG